MVEGEERLGADAVQDILDRAVEAHVAGQPTEAEALYRQVLDVEPTQPVALHLLGVLSLQGGHARAAVDLISQALSVAPEYAEAHDNLGVAWQNLNQMNNAVASHQRAIALLPDNVSAHFNLGNSLRALKRFEEAVVSYRGALAIDANHIGALLNLGNTLHDLEKMDEAAALFRRAISVFPDFSEAHKNLANVLYVQEQLDAAAEQYRKALSINPHQADVYFSLGRIAYDQGQIDAAMDGYSQAVAIDPDHTEAWNNLKFCAKAQAVGFVAAAQKEKVLDGRIDFNAPATTEQALFDYYLDSFHPDEAALSFDKAQASLPPKSDEVVTINGAERSAQTKQALPNNLVALLHFGRSGTGLLHSLIDGHPEVSTLPSIYLRGFFDKGVWSRLISDGWQHLPERFADTFPVLFDAHSRGSVPGRMGKPYYDMGVREGMTSLGEARDEALSLDRDRFCQEARNLMEGRGHVDPSSFLMIVHAAFEKTLGLTAEQAEKKKTAFYHLHNPDDYAKLNFVRHVPDARLLMMVREPVQSCESWIRSSASDSDYDVIVHRIVEMLLGIDQVMFRKLSSIGVRLEDLQRDPDATLGALTQWLGVERDHCLYQMTAQGKKWWGDPSSPNFKTGKGQSPFGDAVINRPVGAIFGEKDQFVLRTLFYPFSARFGYVALDQDKFEKDLATVPGLLKEPLDFENALFERTDLDAARVKTHGAYRFLRACLLDRWHTLDKYKTYPHLLQPLQIK